MGPLYSLQLNKNHPHGFGQVAYQILSPGGLVVAVVFGNEVRAKQVLDMYNGKDVLPVAGWQKRIDATASETFNWGPWKSISEKEYNRLEELFRGNRLGMSNSAFVEIRKVYARETPDDEAAS